MARSHNEWFRPVYLKTVWEEVTEPCFRYCTGCWGLEPCDLCGGTGFRTRVVAVGEVSKRKTCPNCKANLTNILEPQGGFVWSWGEYQYGRWKTILHFCRCCFKEEVQTALLRHIEQCGCEVNLVGKGCTLPPWLTLDKETTCAETPT